MAADVNGAEKLLKSIIEEAHSQAAAAEARASFEADEIRKRAEQEREKLRLEYEEKARASREDILAKARTGAELESRKDRLGRRTALIDEAYEEAYAALCSLAPGSREKVLRKLLENECEGGETVRPAEKDRAALEKLVESMPEKKLALGENEPGLEGGFTLWGANYFKDCSFRALMDETRERTKAETASVLFS
ncbi:MAG: hypothetical protein K6G56_01895 [Clostridiales bacterium]|nr:hypothetical protein [Clostridiales bacterium]